MEYQADFGVISTNKLTTGTCQSDEKLAIDKAQLECMSNTVKMQRYLSKSTGIGDFERRISGLLKIIGIDCWSHTAFNKVIDALDVFGRWPEEFRQQYAKEEFYRDDLILRHMMASEKPVFLNKAFESLKAVPLECGILNRNLEIQKLFQRFGVHNAFSIPVVHENYRAALALSAKWLETGKFEQIIVERLPFLRSLAVVVDNIGRKKFARQFHGKKIRQAIPIQQKPLQLLIALATKDLSLNEVAHVFEISISTANQQIAAAKRAFGTNTTHGTVVAAILGGYIILDI